MDINDIYGRLRGLIMAKPREARSRLTLYVGSAVAAKIREWFDAGHPPLRLKATQPLPEGAFFRFDGAPVIISDIDGEQGMGALEHKETPMAEPQDLLRWADDGGPCRLNEDPKPPRQPTVVEQAKAIVSAFQQAHPGKRIAITLDGRTELVDHPPSREAQIRERERVRQEFLRTYPGTCTQTFSDSDVGYLLALLDEARRKDGQQP